MSAAAARIEVLLGFNQCCVCSEVIDGADANDSYHAVPCGHVICSACFRRMDTRPPTAPTRCCAPGCERTFRRDVEWPRALCVRRRARVEKELALRLADQGDAGERPVVIAPLPSSEWEVCVKHKQPIDSSHQRPDGTERPCCAVCVAALTPSEAECVYDLDDSIEVLKSDIETWAEDLTEQEALLDDHGLSIEAHRAELARWAETQTAIVRAWEDTEIKQVQATAAEALALIETARASREASGSAALVALRATLGEIETMRANLPKSEGRQVETLKRISADVSCLARLLDERSITVVTPKTFDKWRETFAQVTDVSVPFAFSLSPAPIKAAAAGLLPSGGGEEGEGKRAGSNHDGKDGGNVEEPVYPPDLSEDDNDTPREFCVKLGARRIRKATEEEEARFQQFVDEIAAVASGEFDGISHPEAPEHSRQRSRYPAILRLLGKMLTIMSSPPRADIAGEADPCSKFAPHMPKLVRRARLST